MDINATLFGEMITFAVFVWFTMRFIWPILEKILTDRRHKIAEGLAAAERGHTELEVAQKYAIQHIQEARAQATTLIEASRKQAVLITEEAQKQVALLKEQSLIAGRRELARERLMVASQLKAEQLALLKASSEKILARLLTDQDQTALVAMIPKANDADSSQESPA